VRRSLPRSLGVLLLCNAAVCLPIGCRDEVSGDRATESKPSILFRCPRSETEQIVASFVSAFNRGDLAALDRHIATEPSFQWFSVSTGPGRRVREEANNRSSLAAYFASRHRVAERLELKRFRFNNRTFGSGGFTFGATRTANDLNTGTVRGKGAVGCTLDPPSIVVWSMG